MKPARIERISAEQLEARLPQPVAALSLEQIVALAAGGLSVEEIIARVTTSGSRYRLSASRIVELAQQGVPLALLDHLVASERKQIFDDMAAETSSNDRAWRDRLEHELSVCRNPMLGPMVMPGPYPMINCFPLAPGSPFWRCL